MLALFFCANVSIAQNRIRSSFVWDTENVTATIVGDSVDVRIDYILLDDKVERGASISLQPELKCIDRTLVLEALLVYGKDTEMRYGEGYAIRTGRKGRKVTVVSRVPYYSGMDNFSISVQLGETRGGKVVRGEKRQVAVLTRKPCPEFIPELYLIEPPKGISRERETQIELVLVYSEDGNMIDPDLGDNEVLLGDFMGRCGRISLDARTKVSGIQLYGYTGIEGTESDNRKRISARIRNLNAILNEGRIFGRRKAVVRTVGEDWDRVADWFGRSYWSDRDDIRSVLQGSDGKDSKEALLKRNHTELWDAMKREGLLDIDRFVCSLTYTVDDFYTQEELIDAYRTEPDFLDPKDFYRLTSAYEPCSYGWLAVLLKGAEIWPDSYYANYNAAAALLMMGKQHEAGSYLRLCEHTDDVVYMQAVLQYRLGNMDTAEHLIKGINGGRREIAEAKDLLHEIRLWKESVSPWDVRLYSIGQPW